MRNNVGRYRTAEEKGKRKEAKGINGGRRGYSWLGMWMETEVEVEMEMERRQGLGWYGGSCDDADAKFGDGAMGGWPSRRQLARSDGRRANQRVAAMKA